MRKKVIFLVVNNFFTRKYYYDLHIDVLSKYFDVEMWCSLKLLSQKTYDELEKLGMPDQLENVVNIETLEEFEDKIRALEEPPIIITQFFYVLNLRELFNIIKKYEG